MKIIGKYIIIGIITCAVMVWIGDMLLRGVALGKEKAKLIEMCGMLTYWEEELKPQGKSLDSYFENGPATSQNGIKHPTYVSSNLVFNIEGTNITTLFSEYPGGYYTYFMTTNGIIIRLYKSGDVKIINDPEHPTLP